MNEENSIGIPIQVMEQQMYTHGFICIKKWRKKYENELKNWEEWERNHRQYKCYVQGLQHKLWREIAS